MAASVIREKNIAVTAERTRAPQTASQAKTPDDAMSSANPSDANLVHIDHPFAPIYDENSRVLIVGTMASPKSREIGFYYGHPRNRFWKVMSTLLNEELPLTNKDREALLIRNHIALWDVLASCDIQGASDASIKHAIPNDFDPLFASAPIKAVFATGAKAYELYERFNPLREGVEVIKLPSSSPANAATSTEELIAAYRSILRYLSENTPDRPR